MKLKKSAAFAAAFGVALAVTATALPANAEPVSDGYVIVGSDTLQDAVNALANGTTITGSSVRTSGLGKVVASYDAFGSTYIQTRPGQLSFPRPNGSGAGIKALSRAIDGTVWNGSSGVTGSFTLTGQIDMARSSSGANASGAGSVDNNGTLKFVPFGRDGVSYAIKGGAGVSQAALADAAKFTTAQLKQIYTDAPGSVKTSTDQVPVYAKLPQKDSGTRKFFLSTIGASSTPTTAVPDEATTALAENDGKSLAAVPANTIWIIPFSAASFIAQSNGAVPSNTTTGVTLGSPNNVVPFTTSGSALVPNKSFYDTAFGRDTYIVVPYAKIDPASASYDAGLAAAVDPTEPQSLAFFEQSARPATTSAGVKEKFGFLAPQGSSFRTSSFNN